MGKPVSIKEGAVEVVLQGPLALPPKAGTLTEEDMARLVKAHEGLGQTCADTADAMTKKGASFVVPTVTAEALAAAGVQVLLIESLIGDMTTLLAKVKQGKLLIDAEAIEILRKVNSQVNAQGKFDANLFERFAELGEYFGRK